MALLPPTQLDQTHHTKLLNNSLRQQTEPKRVPRKVVSSEPCYQESTGRDTTDLFPMSWLATPAPIPGRALVGLRACAIRIQHHPYFGNTTVRLVGRRQCSLTDFFCFESHKYGGELVA